MEVKKPITRRRFFVFCIRSAWGLVLFSLFPASFFVEKKKGRFQIQFKRFLRGDLYEKHNLAG